MKAQEIIARAEALMHVHEEPQGSNRGPEIDRWAANAGVPLGSPWCSLFVCWGVLGGLRPRDFRPSASALNLWGKNGHLWLPDMAARPGDIYVMDHGRHRGHTGIVKEILPGGQYFRDISGNSNDAGSREGWKVCSNLRLFSSTKLVGFIRVWEE